MFASDPTADLAFSSTNGRAAPVRIHGTPSFRPIWIRSPECSLGHEGHEGRGDQSLGTPKNPGSQVGHVENGNDLVGFVVSNP